MAHRPTPPVPLLAALVLAPLAPALGCDSGASSEQAPLEAPVPTDLGADEAEPAPAAQPDADEALPAPAEQLVEEAFPAAEGAEDPVAVCRRAMARGESYTGCIVERLEGRAETPRELEALIESHRASGNQPAAFSHMQTYLRRYPSTPKARNYRQILAAHGVPPQ